MQTVSTITDHSAKRTWASMQDTADEALIASIAGGDKRAMQMLFGRHNVKVYRFILRMVGREAVAEDLVNEVFLDVWRQASRFEGRSKVSTWLLAIARFKALSALRQRQDGELDDDAIAAIEDTSDNPEEVLVKQERATLMRKCMDQLSAAHREIIDLVYYHEKSVEEVSDIIGVPQNTVKTRMFYARKRLADLLKEQGIDRLAS
jgi:RNA polymerase sigma-70 factor (ECF subfamily)